MTNMATVAITQPELQIELEMDNIEDVYNTFMFNLFWGMWITKSNITKEMLEYVKINKAPSNMPKDIQHALQVLLGSPDIFGTDIRQMVLRLL